MTNILIAILLFSILVLFHEFGHFIAAKAVGIGVIEFSLGMGPRILSFKKGETRYSWKLIPFGGSCAMVGEDEESPAENAFGSKPAWARLLVVAAGPIFNVILAFIACLFIIGQGGVNLTTVHSVKGGSAAAQAGIEAWKDSVVSFNGKKISMGRELYVYLQLHPLDGSDVSVTLERDGERREVVLPTKVEGFRIGISYNATAEAAKLIEVSENSPAEKAGLKANDVILSINGNDLASGEAMRDWLNENPIDGTPLSIVAERGGERFTVQLVPEAYTAYELGFEAFYVYDDWNGNIWVLIRESFREVKYWLSYTFMSLKMLVSGKVGVRDLSGPVGIVSTIGTVVDTSMENGGVSAAFLNIMTLMALLSVNLGIMNLLPIPALDGGRILMLLIEIIFRKKLPARTEGMVNLIGFILLMILMAAVLFSDVLKLFGR